MKHWLLGLVGVVIGVFVFSIILQTCNDTATVIHKEFAPQALLKKYEWFKDASATIDQKAANIQIYKQRLASMKESYGSTPRKNWDRTDKEQYNLWEQEISGMIASYNATCADYNAQMSKFNWKFTNAGDLPDGATKVLPREYKPYEINGDSK